MKLLAAATLAAGASAAINVRDVQDIEAVLMSVGTRIAALTTSIQSYNGGSVDAQLTVGQALDSVINAGKTSIGTDTLGIVDAFSLSTRVSSLASLATPLVSALSAKRSLVESASSCSQVASLVNAVFNDGSALISSVLALVVSDARPLATMIAAPLQAQLSSASADYAACMDVGGGGPGPSSSTTPSGGGGGSGPSSSTTPSGGGGGPGPSSTPTTPGSSGGGSSTPTPGGGSSTPTPGGGSSAPTSGGSNGNGGGSSPSSGGSNGNGGGGGSDTGFPTGGVVPTNTGAAGSGPGTGVVPTAAAAVYAPAGALALAAAVLVL